MTEPDADTAEPSRLRVSRRRALAVAGGAVAGGAAVAAAILPGRRGAPADPPSASAPTIATTTVGGELPLPTALAGDASPEFRAVAEALIESMRANQVPGAALGIWSGDREEHAAAGVASANTMVPVGPDTLFQIGSLAKTYTATAIWRLIERGAISADAPVRRYLPDLRLADEATAEAVTINNLLQHSGGWWGDEGTYTGEGDDALARFVAQRLPQLPQIFPVGKFFSYNNSGFILLGRIIEVVTGKGFHAAMDDLLLGPLGVQNTLYDRAKVLQHPYADGHYAGQINGADGVAVQTPLWLPRSVDPAGGLWSTTRDVLRYARMHLGDALDGKPALLSPESLRGMQEPTKDVPGLPVRIGRNWFVQDIGGMRAIIHNGDTVGQHTAFIAIPEKRFALVLLTNSLTGAVAAELATIDAALSHYPGLAPLTGKVGLSRAGMAPPDAATVTLPAAELADYTGHFADPGVASTFAVRDGELTVLTKFTAVPNTLRPAVGPLSPAEPVPVGFLAKDSGVAGGARVPFVRDDAGQVGWVSGGLRLVPRAKPV
ncbi:CubicO group peptidase (beta-lactamase class C family) [Mycobacterium frederiksbergense]|uniref:CubicO group peptidase (Beta-lactamase class C family) n=1 Tax=Mycolicibacterium frederiksbergense TaxID=117567 RepID=A0ABT6L5V7_9MYCO|nr:serine hydrolase domain-containing protein [Mycolicibacterium frederiksbergense]MDH6198309.1 CubicO group peptidase (beta-lactamase class C family) [Mycolicibacterium frederiksbergense]